MKWTNGETRRWVSISLTVCCMLAVSTLSAQSKNTAKQAASLEKSGEESKAAVQDALGSLDRLLAGYNSIINGEAAKPESAYKKLVGDLKATEKKIEGAKKKVASLNKEADKFFKAWEKDLAEITSESLREKSATRMNDAKQRYATLVETIGKANDEFTPVVQNLNDQILFLGRDLSPDAIADLKDEAAELNQQAAEAGARVKELLQTVSSPEIEADSTPEDQ